MRFTGPERAVRAAAAELVAAWDDYRAEPDCLPAPTSVYAEVAALRAALGGSAEELAAAVRGYLRGEAFWCDEPLRRAELRLRRVAYPLPWLQPAPELVLARTGPAPEVAGWSRPGSRIGPAPRPLPPGINRMPFRAGRRRDP